MHTQQSMHTQQHTQDSVLAIHALHQLNQVPPSLSFSSSFECTEYSWLSFFAPLIAVSTHCELCLGLTPRLPNFKNQSHLITIYLQKGIPDLKVI